MLWPFEWKYSRKPVRISFDFMQRFYCSAAKSPGCRGRPGKPRQALMRPYFSSLARTAPMVRSCAAASSCSARPASNAASSLRSSSSLQGSPVFGGICARRRSKRSMRSERGRGLVQRAHGLRPLVGALRREDFARFRIDAVRQRAHDCQCLCLIHSVHLPLYARCVCEEERRVPAATFTRRRKFGSG